MKGCHGHEEQTSELMRKSGKLDWELERALGTSGIGGELNLRRKDRGSCTGGKGWVEHEMEDW